MTQHIINPTVGRIVWFRFSEFARESGFARHRDGQPYAAIITRVWSDTCVDLTVFDADGAAHSRTSVVLWQGEGVPFQSSYCEWMPYEKGQAAKADSVGQAKENAQHVYPSHRERLELELAQGAAMHLAQNPSQAADIANGIKTLLDKLSPVCRCSDS